MSGPPSSTPLVSVIVRTRHRPAFLADALADIAGQTHRDLEVVVVNDTDEVEEAARVIRDAQQLGLDVRIVDRAGMVHGRSQAANAGVRAARGEFLVIHDDDDTWAPEFLERTLAHFQEHPESVAVSAHTEVVIHRSGPDGDREERLLLNPALTAITIPDMLKNNRVTTNSLLYRASLHDEIGYLDETLAVHEDWDLYLRLLARHPIELLPLPALAFWHHRPEASGDEANSVFALSVEHDTAHARVLDDRIRTGLSADGWAQAILLTETSTHLEKIQQDAMTSLLARLDDLEARLLQQDEQRSRELHDLKNAQAALIVARTSIGHRLRQFFRRR